MKATFFLLLFLVFSSCKIKFTDKDLISYNIYSVNDTLRFKNDDEQVKTFVITSKSIINKGWDANTGWYNPQVAYIKYEELNSTEENYHDNSFLTIYQGHDKKATENLYFNGFNGDIKRSEQKIKEKENLVYKVPQFDMETVRDSLDVAFVYWTDENGIISYDLKNGEQWILIK